MIQNYDELCRSGPVGAYLSGRPLWNILTQQMVQCLPSSASVRTASQEFRLSVSEWVSFCYLLVLIGPVCSVSLGYMFLGSVLIFFWRVKCFKLCHQAGQCFWIHTNPLLPEPKNQSSAGRIWSLGSLVHLEFPGICFHCHLVVSLSWKVERAKTARLGSKLNSTVLKRMYKTGRPQTNICWDMVRWIQTGSVAVA